MRTIEEDGMPVLIRYRHGGMNTSRSFVVYDTDDTFDQTMSNIIQMECQREFHPLTKPYGLYCEFGNTKCTYYTTMSIDTIITNIKSAINRG